MTGQLQGHRQIADRRSPFEHLLDLIEKGELRPGHRLRETELAERLGISRTPVRSWIHSTSAAEKRMSSFSSTSRARTFSGH